MARFIGFVQGQRGEASRLGHRRLIVNANGWGGGINVHLYVGDDGEDFARVTLTGGTNGGAPMVTLFDGPINAKAREMWAMTDKWAKEESNA